MEKSEAFENDAEKKPVASIRFFGRLVLTTGENVPESMRFRLKTHYCGQCNEKENGGQGRRFLHVTSLVEKLCFPFSHLSVFPKDFLFGDTKIIDLTKNFP